MEGGKWRRRLFRPFLSTPRWNEKVAGGKLCLSEVCLGLPQNAVWAVAVPRPIARLALQRPVASALLIFVSCIHLHVPALQCGQEGKGNGQTQLVVAHCLEQHSTIVSTK